MKRIGILIFALLFADLCRSQVFNGGLILGGMVTSVDGAGVTSSGNSFQHLGLSFGGLLNVKLNERNTLEMELTYDMKGSKVNPQYDSLQQIIDTGYYTLRLNYIDMTVLYRHKIHFNLSGSPTDKFEIEAGANLGILASYYYQAFSITYLNSADNYRSPAYNVYYAPINIGLMVGFRYDVSNNFAIDFRYLNSINSVFENSPAVSSFYPYYGSWQAGHNLAFQLNFIYTFGKPPASQNKPTAPVQNN